jgi:hypothetical protein
LKQSYLDGIVIISDNQTIEFRNIATLDFMRVRMEQPTGIAARGRSVVVDLNGRVASSLITACIGNGAIESANSDAQPAVRLVTELPKTERLQPMAKRADSKADTAVDGRLEPSTAAAGLRLPVTR